jgi:hypothetical protein
VTDVPSVVALQLHYVRHVRAARCVLQLFSMPLYFIVREGKSRTPNPIESWLRVGRGSA